jgi:hypothetical protein
MMVAKESVDELERRLCGAPLTAERDGPGTGSRP